MLRGILGGLLVKLVGAADKEFTTLPSILSESLRWGERSFVAGRYRRRVEWGLPKVSPEYTARWDTHLETGVVTVTSVCITVVCSVRDA